MAVLDSYRTNYRCIFNLQNFEFGVEEYLDSSNRTDSEDCYQDLTDSFSTREDNYTDHEYSFQKSSFQDSQNVNASRGSKKTKVMRASSLPGIYIMLTNINTLKKNTTGRHETVSELGKMLPVDMIFVQEGVTSDYKEFKKARHDEKKCFLFCDFKKGHSGVILATSNEIKFNETKREEKLYKCVNYYTDTLEWRLRQRLTLVPVQSSYLDLDFVGSWHGPHKIANIEKFELISYLCHYMNSIAKTWVVGGDFNLKHDKEVVVGDSKFKVDDLKKEYNIKLCTSNEDPLMYVIYKGDLEIVLEGEISKKELKLDHPVCFMRIVLNDQLNDGYSQQDSGANAKHIGYQSDKNLLSVDEATKSLKKVKIESQSAEEVIEELRKESKLRKGVDEELKIQSKLPKEEIDKAIDLLENMALKHNIFQIAFVGRRHEVIDN